MNTCANCKHVLYTNIEGKPIWYNIFCKASRRREATDPVTGEKGFVASNDLGGTFVSDQRFDFARDVNKGNCILFKEQNSV